ncbi:MAG: hypothetical protein ACOZIN_15835 [Myxococcota bacterium]
MTRRQQSFVLWVYTTEGPVLEYLCASREKARYWAAVFALGPTWLPPPTRVRPAGRARKARPLAAAA